MKLVFDLLFVVVILLIKIGDCVRFVFSLFWHTICHLYNRFSQLLPAVLNRIDKATFSSQFFNITQHKVTKKRKTKKKKTSLSFLSYLRLRYVVLSVVVIITLIAAPISSYQFIQTLPNPKQLSTQQIPQTTKIYDRNHVLLYQIYANQNRTVVPLKNIPKSLQQATIAIEDKNFYSNPGFDITGMARAFLADIQGKKLQGGSTLTQQLIKSTLLTPDPSIIRKIKEVILAFWAERIYNKQQILQMYFNTVAYGGTAWGVEAASETYFGKPVKDLDLAQSAFLAGMPQEPTVYSPYGTTPNIWKDRQKEVLFAMQQQGYITKQQEQQADKEQLTFQKPVTPIRAPHFVMYIKDLLTQKYGEATVEKGGLTVITSLDINIQDMAQQVVSNEVANDAYLNLTNGAALVTNPKNGDILAMVGSHDYNDPNGGSVNLTTSLRQPGSSIKVVTYSAALSRGFTAATLLNDSPTDFNGYTPVNYDGRFHGEVPLRIALANSLNIPAVKTLQAIGIPTMVQEAKDMGITSWGNPDNYGLSLTLGAAEVTMTDMATVYGTLANEGDRVYLNPFLKVIDSHGNVLEEKNTLTPVHVLDAGVTYILSNILADNNARTMEFGPNSPLYIPGHTVSVKTGTTDNKKDNWTDGYTSNYVVITWVGNNDSSPMSQVLASGITGAAPIWHNIMTNLLSQNPETPLPQPSDVIAKFCQGHNELFLAGTQNSVYCKEPLTPSPLPQVTEQQAIAPTLMPTQEPKKAPGNGSLSYRPKR